MLVHLGVALHQQSKSAEAVRVLSKAIQLEPKFALAKFHRATAYLAMDRYTSRLEAIELEYAHCYGSSLYLIALFDYF